MWTLPKYRPVTLWQSSEAFRDLMRTMTAIDGLPDLDAGATVAVAISEGHSNRQFLRATSLDPTRHARIVDAITGESRDDEGLRMRPAEILVVRRYAVWPAEPGQQQTSDPQRDFVRIYIDQLWDTDERRGMIEVARDVILAAPVDELPVTAQMLAAEALPFAHVLLVELIREERRLLAAGPRRR